MLSLITSTLLFSFLIWMGNVLMFLKVESYGLILCFFVFMLFMPLFYREGNCRSLEFKDFLLTALLTLLNCILLVVWQDHVRSYEGCYLYLITFLSLVLYANSVRFKSLM